MMKAINLASKSCCGPTEVSSMPEEFYPEFHYSGDKELEIPEEGVMEIRYKKVSSEERQGRDGKEHYSCTIEVREIIKVEGQEEVEAPAKSGSEAADALDQILESLEELKESDKKVHEELK